MDELIRLVRACLTKAGIHVLAAGTNLSLPRLRGSMVTVELASCTERAICSDDMLAYDLGIGASRGRRIDAELLLEIYAPYRNSTLCLSNAKAITNALSQGIDGWTLGAVKTGEAKYDPDCDCYRCEVRVNASAYAYTFTAG